MARITNDEKWAPVIGRLFIAFGSIESSVNKFLSFALTAANLKFVVVQQLGERVRLLEALLPESNIPANDQEVLLLNLRDAIRLSKVRNVVAHNPLALAFFDQKERSELPVMEEAIISERDKDKRIKFSALEKDVTEAELVSDALGQNARALTNRVELRTALPQLDIGKFDEPFKKTSQMEPRKRWTWLASSHS